MTQEYIASILEYDKTTHMALIQVKNHFEMKIPVEVFGPDYTRPMILNPCFDENGIEVDVANKPMQLLKTRIDFEVKENDMIRKIVDKSDRHIY